MVFVHVRGVLYGILQKRKEKRNEKKKSECTCHWKACSAFSGCFCSSFIHSVCTIYDHAFGVYIDLKDSVIKGVIKGYIILCTVHYLLLIMADRKSVV